MHSSGDISDHVRTINLTLPIEYSSDIKMIQEWAANEVGGIQTMLVSWTALKGETRPVEDNVPKNNT
tara:strand:+ start:82867 stop:83067 length:201 start_codon:yes stop_codon:yes gene_type:complete